MQSKCCRLAGLLFLWSLVGQVPAADAQLWKNFVPTKRVEADPHGDYTLTENKGPWLIVAATFSGDGAEDQARRLTLELRERYNLTAYLHKMSFEFSDEATGRGNENYGAPVKRRYRREGDLQFAVLIGDFPRIDDPESQQLLDRVKHLQPESLRVDDGGKTAQSLVQMWAPFRIRSCKRWVSSGNVGRWARLSLPVIRFCRANSLCLRASTISSPR